MNIVGFIAKTAWAGFSEVFIELWRTPQHVASFFRAPSEVARLREEAQATAAAVGALASSVESLRQEVSSWRAEYRADMAAEKKSTEEWRAVMIRMHQLELEVTMDHHKQLTGRMVVMLQAIKIVAAVEEMKRLQAQHKELKDEKLPDIDDALLQATNLPGDPEAKLKDLIAKVSKK